MAALEFNLNQINLELKHQTNYEGSLQIKPRILLFQKCLKCHDSRLADVEPVDSQWGRQVRGHADGQVHGPTHPGHREHGPWLGLQQAGHRRDVSQADGRSCLHKQLHCQVCETNIRNPLET